MAMLDAEPTILKSLNKAQRRAVTSKVPTVAILAGPGSGKTHTLTSRVVWLIRHQGFQPTDIIVATFTVKAAREMKERMGKALGEHCEKKIILGTFHSIARRYLSIYGNRIGLDSKFGIADDGDSKAIIQRICKRLGLGVEPLSAKSWISKRKAKGPNAEVPQKSKKEDNVSLERCYKEYQEQLTRSNLLDYDDLLVKCVELLQKHPVCVSNIQAVLIDEYQDTNGIQYELMKLFAQERERITIVGDPDQSIYGWRSAEIRNLFRLLRDYPNTDEISLEENYRSSQLILSVSLSVIQQDNKRYQKVLLPVHTKGARPVLRKLVNPGKEGEWIVSEIRRVIMMFGTMLKHEDIAILLRSASLSRHIETALGKAGMGYRMVGGHKFYERKEIKILVDYLRVVYHPNNNDALARVINVPRRGIGDNTIKSLIEEAEQAKMSVWSLLLKHCRGVRKATTNIRSNMEQKLNTQLIKIILHLRRKMENMSQSGPFTLVNLIEELLSQLNFKSHLADEYAEEHEQRWANVQEFLVLAGDFLRDFGSSEEDALPEIEDLEQVKEDDVLGRFLANISLASDTLKDDPENKASLVTISTIHAAKGLEWPVVFVPSVYTGSIPHARSEDLDEERRLLYVAMTRAKTLLYLSYPMYGSLNMGAKVELSPFISSFSSTAFTNKGTSFDRPIIDAVAKILGREAPSEKEVYGTLPSMFSVEDDLFPIEPLDPKDRDNIAGDSVNHHSRAPKRQRTAHPTGSCNEFDEQPWKRDYNTTMEQSSNFTVSSLPGFVSAGAHKTALEAAAVAAAAQKAASAKPTIKKGTTRRGADQKSLAGYLTRDRQSNAMQKEESHAESLSHKRYQAAMSRCLSHPTTRPLQTDISDLTTGGEKPAIDPALTKHKLGAVKPIVRPNLPKIEDGTPKSAYHCFSSSPPREAKEEEDESRGKPEDEIAAVRPASSFHATTFVSARLNGGVRRPVGLGPPPSMDRLRKPFKPLTISRPRGPTGK